MGFVFSSCEISAPVCASMMRVDSQQGQISVKRGVSVTTRLLRLKIRSRLETPAGGL
jgi:hypothetical protein